MPSAASMHVEHMHHQLYRCQVLVLGKQAGVSAPQSLHLFSLNAILLAIFSWCSMRAFNMHAFLAVQMLCIGRL